MGCASSMTVHARKTGPLKGGVPCPSPYGTQALLSDLVRLQSVFLLPEADTEHTGEPPWDMKSTHLYDRLGQTVRVDQRVSFTPTPSASPVPMRTSRVSGPQGRSLRRSQAHAVFTGHGAWERSRKKVSQAPSTIPLRGSICSTFSEMPEVRD